MCIDSRGKNRGQLDQFISTQYLVWTNSLLQLFPMSTHILLNWVPNKNKLLENFWNPLVRLLRPKIFWIVKMILEFKKNFVRPISDLCSFLLPKWNTKLLYLSEIICKKSNFKVKFKISKNCFCLNSIIFSVTIFCAILGRVSLSTLHSTNHALWSWCPFRFVVIEPSSLNASQPWHTLEVRIVWSHTILQSKSKHIGFAGWIKTIELFRDTQFSILRWEVERCNSKDSCKDSAPAAVCISPQ